MASVKKTKLECSNNADDVGQKQNIWHRFTFHIGSSWAARDRSFGQPPYPFDSDIASWKDLMLNFTRKVTGKEPGDDFFFIQEMHNQSGISFGVADGVGGWRDRGVDPSIYSQALMYHAHRHSRNALAGKPEIDPTMDCDEKIESQVMTPYECLHLAYNSVTQDEQVVAGSSTACIVSLNASSGVLRSANLGDSGYLIIRSNSVYYMTRPQTIYFNHPWQLAKDTGDEEPSMADRHEVELCDGDIIVVYTDGLSDNVFPSEIITIVRSCIAEASGTEDEQVQAMADSIVDYAQQCMSDATRASPFQRAFSSGKPLTT